MSADNCSTVKTVALGRHFELGMLYNLRNDQLTPETLLWTSELMSKYICSYSSASNICEIHTKDTFMKRADLLGMDANLKMSVLTGLVEVSRSAELIHSRKTTQHKQRFILKYSITTCRYELDMTQLNQHQQIFDEKLATHVVTSILYGAEVYFVFEAENHADVGMMVIKLLEKMTMFHEGQLNLNENEKAVAQSLTCRCYADIDLDSNLMTFLEAAKLFKQLPKFLDENSIPKQVCLYPLHLLNKSNFINNRICPIDNDLADRSLKIIERLHRLEIIVNDLRNTVPSERFFYLTEQQFSIFSTHIHQCEIAMKRKLKKLLDEIRCDIIEEIELDYLLQKIDLILFNEYKLHNWIQFLIELITILTGFFYDLSKQGNIDMADISLLQQRNDRNYEFILCLTIHLTGENDPFSSEMLEYLNDITDKQRNENLNIYYRFNQDNIGLIRNKVALFSEFATINRRKENVKFIAEQQYDDDFQMKKGVSIILYHEGAAEFYEIPTRPGKPYATNISSQGLTLNWLPPTNGSQNIQQYNVYGRINTSNTCTILLATKDATPSAVISDLDIGKYQFKVQGVTLLGDTADSDISDIIEKKPPVLVLPDPTPQIVTPPPRVIPSQVTTEKAILDVTPAWFEPVKPVNPDRIRLPANYNKNSSHDVRTYDCLSAFRSVIKKSIQIDFVAEPFKADVQNIETVIVVLNELAHQLNTRLTFTHADFGYNDSDYRTACGVANLGSIHSFLTSEGNFLTAKFNLHLKLDYGQITASTEALRTFVLTIINDITTISQCNKDFIRIFSISRVESILVGFGITTPELHQTKTIADSVKQKLNQVSSLPRQSTFRHLVPESYDYKLEPALAYLQLQESDFEPCYNRSYPNAQQDIRGGYPYYFPQGWYRHALKVVGKYPGDQVWLGMNNSPGEWAVAYHGTNSGAVRDITKNGLLQSLVTNDAMKSEAMAQNPNIPNVQGLYVATHCEGGASDYARSFTVIDSKGNNKKYQVVFQCRVRPRRFTKHKSPVRVGMAWRIFDEKAIRPYGLLLKSS